MSKMMNNLLTVRIQEHMEHFSKGQRLIAKYIEEHYDKVAFMTASKLGATVGVSESTVVRFATEIGYAGYPELQKAVLHTDYLAYSGTVTTAGAIDTSHRRFLKNPYLMFYEPVPETAYGTPFFEYDISTFCGLLVNADMVRKIGLPKTEYFIWFDDTEYCLRFHDQSRILNVTTAVLNHKTAPVGSAPVISWKNYYGFRNAIDIGKTYSKNPHLYMAYIWLNHKAHIFLDTFGLLLGNQKEMRRYRIKVYKDVLKNRHKKPDGISPDYLPGSGYKS